MAPFAEMSGLLGFPRPSGPTLSPMRKEAIIVPVHQRARSKAVAMCKRIRNVEIRESLKRDGQNYYVIRVYFKKPISCMDPDSLKQNLEESITPTPDLIVKRRFEQFASLHHEMYFHTLTGHGSKQCDFCAKTSKLLENGPTLQRVNSLLHHGDASIRQSLEGFVNSVIELTSSLTAHLERDCDGQREVPVMVKQFLFDDVDAKFQKSLPPPAPKTMKRKVEFPILPSRPTKRVASAPHTPIHV